MLLVSPFAILFMSIVFWFFIFFPFTSLEQGFNVDLTVDFKDRGVRLALSSI